MCLLQQGKIYALESRSVPCYIYGSFLETVCKIACARATGGKSQWFCTYARLSQKASPGKVVDEMNRCMESREQAGGVEKAHTRSYSLFLFSKSYLGFSR